VFGIPLAIRKSAQAATAAKEAKKAVSIFSKRISLANAAHSYSQVELVRSLISSSNYAAAISVVGVLKRTVFQIAKTLEERNTDVQQGKRNITIVESQLAFALSVRPKTS